MKILVCLMFVILSGCKNPIQDMMKGKSGNDGVPGENGDGNIVYDVMILKKGSCTQVDENTWIENIGNGYLFDVYYNDQCKDALGEFCDNVSTSFGSSGDIGNTEPGASKVCWVDDTQYSGVRLTNGNIELKILTFLEE